MPWAGHLARHAMVRCDGGDQAAKTALVFVNTRSQAERTFQELWRINDDNLPIALHHGSLAPEQRRKVEAAMAKGNLRAVVCTSTLDLGIDWGAVDKVICIGAPKGAARLVQRIGRANHRLDEPSAALLVPANRFEVLECNAARDAVLAGELDGERLKPGGLDVLAQHVLGMACAAPFDADALYRGSALGLALCARSRAPISTRWWISSPPAAMRCKRYDRYARLRQDRDGRWRLAHPRLAQAISPECRRDRRRPDGGDPAAGARASPAGAGGRRLGELEEYFIEQLSVGRHLRLCRRCAALRRPARGRAPMSPAPTIREAEIPSYNGGKFPLSTFLAQRVREMVSAPERWHVLPEPVQEWLKIQEWRSVIPKPGQLAGRDFSRAATAIIWSAIPSKAGWRTRPWACC